MAERNRTIGRRELLAKSATMAAGFALISSANAEPGRSSMTMDLVCGALGVRVDQWKAIELAHRYGFESVGADAAGIAQMNDAQIGELRENLKSRNLVFGAAGLPVDFRKSEDSFRQGLSQLPRVAVGLQKAGVTRMGTWIMPNHAVLTYRKNFKQHVKRLQPIAEILGDHAIRLGLEYVGPKTLWTAAKFSFVHTMEEAQELISAIGHTNVGLVLDSWHWYTARETKEDLLSLDKRDIVAVDLNDAPSGIPVDQQIDQKRALPTTTGVIDLKTFLGALASIGYDGPVRAEPFDAELRKLPAEEAVAKTSAAMKQAFAVIREGSSPAKPLEQE